MRGTRWRKLGVVPCWNRRWRVVQRILCIGWALPYLRKDIGSSHNNKDWLMHSALCLDWQRNPHSMKYHFHSFFLHLRLELEVVSLTRAIGCWLPIGSSEDSLSLFINYFKFVVMNFNWVPSLWLLSWSLWVKTLHWIMLTLLRSSIIHIMCNGVNALLVLGCLWFPCLFWVWSLRINNSSLISKAINELNSSN